MAEWPSLVAVVTCSHHFLGPAVHVLGHESHLAALLLSLFVHGFWNMGK